MKRCTACEDKGWLLADNSDHGLRIERCDSCRKFCCDITAVEFVAQIAEEYQRTVIGIGGSND